MFSFFFRLKIWSCVSFFCKYFSFFFVVGLVYWIWLFLLNNIMVLLFLAIMSWNNVVKFIVFKVGFFFMLVILECRCI